MGNKVPLGRALSKQGVALSVKPKTMEERIEVLEQRLEAMTQAFYEMRNTKPESVERNAYKESGGNDNTNKDGIPVGTVLVGISHGVPYMLNVNKIAYTVRNIEYPSLSAAAEAVSGCRRSGWTFWKLPDGLTAKEVFKDG